MLLFMAEEEIDLRELINVLLRRKYIIMGITLMAILIAGVISCAVLSPVYKSSATFKIARIDGKLLFDISDVENRIKSDNILQEVNNELGLKIAFTKLSGFIKTDKMDNSGYVTVSAEYGSPEKARDIVLSVVNKFIEINQPYYQEQAELLEKERKSIEKQIELEKENMEEVEKLRLNILKSEDLSLTEKQMQINLLLNYSIQIRENYNELVEKYFILENQILNSSNFELIKYPSIPQAPIKPNKKLNLAISGVLGLFLGVFTAFFTEFWQSGKQ